MTALGDVVRAAEMLPLGRLRRAEWNANRVPEKTLAKIRRSIAEFGFVENLVARPHPDEDGVFEVLSGNHRLDLLAELGVERAPVVVVDVGDADARILAQALNRTRGEDDPEAYARLLDDVLASAGADRVTEFLPETEASIDRVLARVRPAPPDEDFAPALKPDSRLGEVYELGPHRLLCGDAADQDAVGRLVGTERFACCVTDPPYGINRDGIENDAPETLRALFDGVLSAAPLADAVVAAFQSPRLVVEWMDAVRHAGHAIERLLWLHRQAAKTYPWRGWVLASDAIVLSSVGDPIWPEPDDYSHDTYTKTELEDVELTGLHTTIKPSWVIRDLLLKLPDGPVYEPFAGSGTTLIAADQVGRACFAVELNPGYCDVIRERYERMRVSVAA